MEPKKRGRPKGSTKKVDPDAKVKIKSDRRSGLRVRTYHNVHADDGTFHPIARLDQYGRILDGNGNPTGRCGSANH